MSSPRPQRRTKAPVTLRDRLVWGDRVRAERVERGWRQEDLATYAGVSQSAVSRLENGSRRIADEVRARIAKVFGLSAVELFPYDEERAGRQLANTTLQRTA